MANLPEWFVDCDIFLSLYHRPSGLRVTRMTTGRIVESARNESAVNRYLASEVIQDMTAALDVAKNTKEGNNET